MDEQTVRELRALSERLDFLEDCVIKFLLCKPLPVSAEERAKLLDGV